MKDTRHGIRPFRSAVLGALGLIFGFIITYFGRWYLGLPNWWYKVHIGISITKLSEWIPAGVNYGLAFALFGLMLCLSISASARLTLRACFIMAGMGVVANLIGKFVVFPLFDNIFNYIYEFEWIWIDVVLVLGTAVIGIVEGLFAGAGLGLAAWGWKSCWRFALKGMLAYGLGSAIGLTIYELWISSSWLRWSTIDTVLIIAVCIAAILTGGILGWMWGKDNPVGMPNEKTA